MWSSASDLIWARHLSMVAATPHLGLATSSCHWPGAQTSEHGRIIAAAAKAAFGRAVQRRADAGGGWLGWAVAVADIAPVEQRLGRKAGEGHRVRPDGHELRWRQIGILDLMEDAQLPYFVQWDCSATEHPSASGGPVAIGRIELCGDPNTIGTWLGEPADSPLDEIAVEWLDGDDAGVQAVWFSTPNGMVRID